MFLSSSYTRYYNTQVLCVHDDGDVEVVFPTAAGPTTYTFGSDNLEVCNGSNDCVITKVVAFVCYPCVKIMM